MKIYSKKTTGLLLSGALLFASLNSCVKNRNDLATNFSAITSIVEVLSWPQPSATPRTFAPLAYTPTDPIQKVLVYVHFSAPQPADKDYVVTLALDPTTIANYNTANNTTYVALATNVWSVDTYKITIKQGQYYGFMTLTINPALLTLGQAAALAFKVVDAGGLPISANFGATMFGISAKSQYDGIYELRGYTLRLTDPILTGPLGPIEKSLSTINANTVGYVENRGWSNAGGSAGIAAPIGNPIFRVEPGNTVTIGSAAGLPGTGTDLHNNPGFTSRYDPATRTFYTWGTWGGGPGVREMNDTLRYLRPRP